MQDIKAFRAEVKKRLYEKRWTYNDLVRETGYAHSTIERFMCRYDKDRDPSAKVAEAIAAALDIPRYMAQ